MSERARTLAKTKADNLKNSRDAESTLFSLSNLSHAFTGKYCTPSVFHAEQSAPHFFGVQMRCRPTTINHVVVLFDCLRYCKHTATRAAIPRFDFDDKTGQTMKRLHGVLRNAKRAHALLLSWRPQEPDSGHDP